MRLILGELRDGQLVVGRSVAVERGQYKRRARKGVDRMSSVRQAALAGKGERVERKVRDGRRRGN